MRIELTTKAWEAFVLPLNYARKIDCYLIVSRLFEMSNKIVLLKENVFLLLYGFELQILRCRLFELLYSRCCRFGDFEHKALCFCIIVNVILRDLAIRMQKLGYMLRFQGQTLAFCRLLFYNQ